MDLEELKKLLNKEKALEIFNKYFVEYLKTQYTNFNGRASRPDYWYFILCVLAISLVLAIIDAVIGVRLFTSIFSFAILIPSVGLGVRRLHDLGKPGWWYFMVLVPLVGAIALLVLFCMKGEDKANAYGEPVK